MILLKNAPKNTVVDNKVNKGISLKNYKIKRTADR